MRERVSFGRGVVVVSLAAGAAGVAGSYGAAGFTPGFVVAPVERTLTRTMPGAVVTFAITVLGDLGQQLNLAFATVLVAAAFAAVTGLALGIGRALDDRLVPVVGTAVAVWALAAALTLRPVLALGAAAAAGAVVAIADLSTSLGRPRSMGTADGNRRRRVVSALGTAAAAGVVGTAIGRRGSGGRAGSGDSAVTGEMVFDVGEELAGVEDRAFHVDGMDPVVSDGFYEVDVNSVNPTVESESWTLSVTGAVEESFELTYDDLREMDHEHRYVTLRCVGDTLNGRKMDTALWTGVPLAPLVERAAPESGCGCVMLRAEDGYYNRFPIEALRPAMLAFGMNGRLLPRGHGAPVRALVPGHWGEVNVKWLTEIEFLEETTEGYWEKRGWQGTGPVKTVAKLHGKTRRETDEGSRVVVGGHAYAGTRGISEVEVSTDGGDTWETAELTDRLPGAWGPAADVGGGGESSASDGWRLWRHEYDPDGVHDVVVRAYERDGTRQPREETGPVPDGPSGWVSETVDPGNL